MYVSLVPRLAGSLLNHLTLFVLSGTGVVMQLLLHANCEYH